MVQIDTRGLVLESASRVHEFHAKKELCHQKGDDYIYRIGDQCLIPIEAIVSTCKAWRQLGTEFLFRFLFFNDPTHLERLSPVLLSRSSLGWWTKRLHVTSYFPGNSAAMDTMETTLVSIIRQCPNLEIFIVNAKISRALAAVVDALCTSCPSSLKTVHLEIPSTSLAKIILMLDSLPALTSIHLEFYGTPPESIHLGFASDLTLTLPRLQQLSLRGVFQDFIEQAAGWNMPALQSLALDFLNHRDDFPEITEFLAQHGMLLTYLDINCIPNLDVATILDLCPLLTTFAFNMDWRLPDAAGELWASSHLVNRPHANITTIGCHQLMYAFGVGYTATLATTDPLTAPLIQRRNDMNFTALNKRNFPRLQRVRVLSRMLLRDLEKADGPSEACFERWERWWDQCVGQGIRLEDCTGASLGTLPQDDDEDNTEEDEEDELPSLKELLDQCRRMSETREESQFIRRSLDW